MFSSDRQQLERDYATKDATTAFIFPAGLLGYLVATAVVGVIRSHHGHRGIAVLAPLTRIVAALLIASRPAFVALLICFSLFSFGSGLTDIAWNNLASRMGRPNVAQGLLHGSFSVGCILGPMFAIKLVQHRDWNLVYFFIVCQELWQSVFGQH